MPQGQVFGGKENDLFGKQANQKEGRLSPTKLILMNLGM
jgi:hypothetical protein